MADCGVLESERPDMDEIIPFIPVLDCISKNPLKRLSSIQISIGILESRVMLRRRMIQISLACRITSRRRGRRRRIQLLRTQG